MHETKETFVLEYFEKLLRYLTGVFDNNLGAGGSGGLGNDLVVLLNVDDGGASNALGGAVGDVRSTGEGDGTEVGESDETAARFEVLHNPFGVLVAQVAVFALVGERVGDGLARAVIHDGRRAGGLAGRLDGGGDLVAGAHLEAGELDGVVGVPLVPGGVLSLAAGNNTRNAGLKDG